MTDLKLDFDEEIILQSTEVERYGIKETSLDEMVLTNKHIICVYNKSTGLFSKPETVLEKIPLSTIKIVDGRVQVMSYNNDDYGLGLQVLFVSGHREHFLFYDEKKELPRWEKAVVKVITEKNTGTQDSNVATPPIDNEMAENKTDKIGDVLTGVSTGLFSAFKGAVDTVKQTILETTSDTAEENNAGHSTNLAEDTVEVIREQKPLTEVNTAEPEEMTKETKKYIYCTNCGEKLTVGSKFCNNCGTPTGSNQVQENNSVQAPIIEPQVEELEKDEPITERQTVYEGKIHKCPNCGEVMKSFSANCPSCGFEIRGSRATTSVQEFAMKLEQIEQKQMPHFEEKSSVMKMVFGKDFKGDDYDIQQAKRDFEKRRKSEKASLISSFPIPNTKEDILEFLLLASSNIDVKTTHDIVTQAWLQKLEQVYQRAQITIRNTNEFKQAKFIYDSKQKELGKQKKNKKNKILGGVALIGAGILLYIIGMMLGEATGDSDSSLYSICMAGFFVMFGGIFLLLSTIPNKD